MKLSILICHLPNRAECFRALILELYRQIGNQFHNLVEVLVCSDEKPVTTGEKRNKLLDRAKGNYIVFIDDDDEVTDDYVSEMLKGIESGADCLGIKGWMTWDEGRRVEWEISKDFFNEDDHSTGTLRYKRSTNHITAVKRELALQARFPEISNAEDKAYSDKLLPLLKTEYKIDKLLYHYKFTSSNKEYA